MLARLGLIPRSQPSPSSRTESVQGFAFQLYSCSEIALILSSNSSPNIQIFFSHLSNDLGIIKFFFFLEICRLKSLVGFQVANKDNTIMTVIFANFLLNL